MYVCMHVATRFSYYTKYSTLRICNYNLVCGWPTDLKCFVELSYTHTGMINNLIINEVMSRQSFMCKTHFCQSGHINNNIKVIATY